MQATAPFAGRAIVVAVDGFTVFTVQDDIGVQPGSQIQGFKEQLLPDLDVEAEEIVEDLEASALYGRREIELKTQLDGAGDALALANLVLQRSAHPAYALPSVTVDVARLPQDLALELLACMPGARITVEDLPTAGGMPPAFLGVIEGWQEVYGADGAHTLTLAISAVEHSTAVPSWDELDPAELWQDSVGDWESELG